MSSRTFRIDERLINKLEQFVVEAGGKYNKSEVISAAIVMFTQNPEIEEYSYEDNSLIRDKETSRAAKYALQMTKGTGKINQDVVVKMNGIDIEIKKGTFLKYKQPHIMQFEPDSGCHIQLAVFEETRFKLENGKWKVDNI